MFSLLLFYLWVDGIVCWIIFIMVVKIDDVVFVLFGVKGIYNILIFLRYVVRMGISGF